MKYSIVIPVFNKADLTRHCLRTLRPTLDGSGEGEVIVVDNASSDETPQILAEFPWIHVIRNDRNLGFAAANNQGARIARGEYLVLLNNDTEPKAGWLTAMLSAASETGVGAVGARLLYPNGTLQHGGVYLAPLSVGKAGFFASHDLTGAPGSHPYAMQRREYQAVTAACMVTPLALYLELGGLDEGYWNGYEDVDYCLKLRERGLRVLYAGDAALTHFESQSGGQRFRKVSWNIARLAERWNGRVHCDMMEHHLARGTIRRTVRLRRGQSAQEEVPVPKTTVVCYGISGADSRVEERLRNNRAPIDRILWRPDTEAIPAARAEMELRGDRYVAIVDGRCDLSEGWLDELVGNVESAPQIGAAANGSGCTLIALAKYPQHVRLGEFERIEDALTDFLARGIALRAGVYGADKAQVEGMLAGQPRRRNGLVSIVMLSWNAPQFTKIALESIRAHTKGEYEVIIVDNGSEPETVDWLRTLQDVRVIYNPVNRGYAGGNNQGLAAARGEYVVLLNNDVVVTEGWLDGLLSAFDRVPALGVSAPRSNKIAGDQIVVDAAYADIEQMHAYAARRRERYRGRGYMTDRAIGLCLCIDRRVIEEIGGIDERFGVGNFEDDDFCLRVRAAGYRIHVCDDVFIHHYGSQTFAANKVDWTATMRENWTKFAAKWNLPDRQKDGGYLPGPAIRRGFTRALHYVPLPSLEVESPAREYAVAFAAIVRDERDWNGVVAFIRRYVRAFGAEHPVLLAIAAAGELPAQTLGTRTQRLAEREGIESHLVADVEICDEFELSGWIASIPSSAVYRVNEANDASFDALPLIQERSPSALRRLAESAVPA